MVFSFLSKNYTVSTCLDPSGSKLWLIAKDDINVWPHTNSIYTIEISSGEILLYSNIEPFAKNIVFDNEKNMYVLVSNVIYKFDEYGEKTLFTTIPNFDTSGVTNFCFNKNTNFFYVSETWSRIVKIDLNGEEVSRLENLPGFIKSMTIDEDNDIIYITVNNTIKKIENFTTVRDFFTSDNSINAIVYLSQALYYLDKLGNLYKINPNDSQMNFLQVNSSVLSINWFRYDNPSNMVASNEQNLFYFTGFKKSNFDYYDGIASIKTPNILKTTITVGPFFDKLITDQPFSLNATSDSPQTVQYNSSDPTIAEVSQDGIVTMKENGSCVIKLYQAPYIGFQNFSGASTNTEIIIRKYTPFGNVIGMTYEELDNKFYIYTTDDYPLNFQVLDNKQNVWSSMNIDTDKAVITTMLTTNDKDNNSFYVGGDFKNLSNNENNKNVSQLMNKNISYSNIKLYVNNEFACDINYKKTAGVMTTNTSKPFTIYNA